MCPSQVPPGTIIRRRDAPEHEKPLAEVVTAGTRVLLAAGGRGGRGNASFKTGRQQVSLPSPYLHRLFSSVEGPVLLLWPFPEPSTPGF